jgi:hypothetical protein
MPCILFRRPLKESEGECVSNKYNTKLWAGFFWLRTGTGEGSVAVHVGVRLLGPWMYVRG